MDKLKLIFVAGITILFVGSSFISLFGAGRMLEAVLKSYVFKVEICDYGNYPYKPVPTMINRDISSTPQEPEKTCKIDYNRLKEDISSGLAMFIISSPLAFVFFRKTRKFIYED